MFACVARSFSQGLLLINPRNIISNIIMLLNINATRGPRIAAQRPTGCCSARLLGCGTRSPLYLIGNAASRRGLSRVGYFITLNGPLNGTRLVLSYISYKSQTHTDDFPSTDTRLVTITIAIAIAIATAIAISKAISITIAMMLIKILIYSVIIIISTTNLAACVCVCVQHLTNFCPYAFISSPNVPKILFA